MSEQLYRIKPLEWSPVDSALSQLKCEECWTPFGLYQVRLHSLFDEAVIVLCGEQKRVESLFDGKRLAQSHYEERVRQFLEPVPGATP